MRRQLAVGDDPNVARARFGSAEGDGKIGHDGHSEAAGHDREAVGSGGDEKREQRTAAARALAA